MKTTELPLNNNISKTDVIYIVNKPSTNPESLSVELGKVLNYKSIVIPKVDLFLKRNKFNLAPKLIASWKGDDEFLKYSPKYTVYRFSAARRSAKSISIPILGATTYEIKRNVFFDVKEKSNVKQELDWTPYGYYGWRDLNDTLPSRQLRKEDFPFNCNFNSVKNSSNLFVMGAGILKRTRCVVLFFTIRILMNGTYSEGPFTKVKIIPVVTTNNSNVKIFNGLRAYIDM